MSTPLILMATHDETRSCSLETMIGMWLLLGSYMESFFPPRQRIFPAYYAIAIVYIKQ